MTLLLLTDDERLGGSLIPRRATARERLYARLHAASLDAALARGACPDVSATLSLRASALTSQRTRRRLAHAIHNLVRDAHRPQHPLSPCVPICRRKITLAQALLEQLAEQLVAPGLVDPRGVAKLRVLLTDSSSPFYLRPRADDLEPAVLATIHALDVHL